ncbi:ArsR family transcriptional regulator [Pseudomonas syringae pv. helianthi]|uniref:ArsR family transcriptional regulator n=1 Tax=Pseudomonas syringae pv. helianthi TaxID=251654 RepID=A0A3M6D5C9_9PSED|nr:helix-turn-helix domain-containing protein [Pseudomonas syringae group genomosp. 7]RMV51335.1 ArsR family transcriptional regulator [Pseudomonas syringae pv. helianthi]UNB65465.1 helix-turn-helix domain-containing protein [Pseudomonas syringae pv. helianthi]
MRAFNHPEPRELALERVLYALSDPVRMEIIRHLADVSEATCGELDGGRPKSSASHHFRVLRDSGLMRTRIVGTTHMNALRKDEIEARFPGLLDSILGHFPSPPL